MLPAGEEMRIRSLAGMARALGRSEALFRLCELAAEETRGAIRAASVSVSRVEPGSMVVRTIVNVGDLGPNEVRWPEDETYTMDEFVNLELVVDDLQVVVGGRRRPRLRPDRAAAAHRAGQGLLARGADRRRRPAVGRVLRHPAARRARLRRRRHRLPGGADRDPRRRHLAVAARGVARAAGLPRPADRAAEPARARRARRPRLRRGARLDAATSPWSRSTSTGSRRSTTPSGTWPATS